MLSTAKTFPADFQDDTRFLDEALVEFNKMRRAQPFYDGGVDLSYSQLGPFSRQWVRAKAQKLKELAKAETRS